MAGNIISTVLILIIFSTSNFDFINAASMTVGGIVLLLTFLVETSQETSFIYKATEKIME